jgi:hypothetical protein
LRHIKINKDQRASGRQVKGFGEIKEKPLSRKMAKSDARKLERSTRRRKWDCVSDAQVASEPTLELQAQILSKLGARATFLKN